MNAGRARANSVEARARRLDDAEGELDRLGAEIDRRRARGETISHGLRAELREAGRRRLALRWSE